MGNQGVCDPGQHHISASVTLAIVDLLKIVQIKVDQGQWIAISTALEIRRLELVDEISTVVQPRQAIRVSQLLLSAVALLQRQQQLVNDQEKN